MAAVQSYGSWGLAGAGEAFATQLLCGGSDFFFPPSCPISPDCFIIFFFLTMFPLLSCGGEVFLGKQAWGWTFAAPGAGWLGLQELRLPSPSRRPRKVQQPVARCREDLLWTICTFRAVLFFILLYSAPVAGSGKALLRWKEKLRKKNPSLLLFDSWQAYFKQLICCQFPFRLVLVAASLNSGCASSAPEGPCLVPVVTAEAVVYFPSDAAVIF